MTDADLDELMREVRSARTLPRLEYHFDRHGREFGAVSVDHYLAAFEAHLDRADLRLFTFLRPEGQVPFWGVGRPGYWCNRALQ